jgi:RNA polymerase sigma factor (sigma-70 family)
MMEINNELVIQWEPKIQKMVSNVYIVGMDRDDIAQELRIALLKTAKAYDPDRGVLFHTYLHTALVNTIRTLISRAQKQLKLVPQSLDITYSDTGLQSADIIEALTDPAEQVELFELEDWLVNQNLEEKELLFLQLRLDGLTMEEITEDLEESAYKVRQTLREKFSTLGYGY